MAPSATHALQPNSTIGILGGGQLARMLALAAAPLGLKCHIYCPDPDSPAFQVSAAHTVADYEDEAALLAFARSVDVITYEFENVPAFTANLLASKTIVAPGPHALEISQDRLLEKNFLTEAGVKVADYFDITSPQDLASALKKLGGKGVLKTRRFGYDGKGQILITPDEQRSATDLLASLNNAPCVLEAFVPFLCEISVIASRSYCGETALFDVALNVHKNHILYTSTVPVKGVCEQGSENTLQMARKIIDKLDYVGTMGVEMFVLDDDIIVNEIAPRVHNSGHWTQNACVTCQFEQHIRAVAGWPLGDTTRTHDVVMQNMIGEEINDWPEHAAIAGHHVHLYGKQETRAGRKMGHVNKVGAPIEG